ncbi:helix-turn-helix transcriptional regulator [Enterococcus hulanensis]|uniref:helix-turn-helix domain-containing protein n=1 Tax=Enterococcus TaxID=1350 RepID=UPI000B5A599E|nr:helix-turn-helix transcriptional regulator [Enterococcus sp. 3H8_DIV0648]MBO0409857.1 helix-turn-helix transcriptional regulator [Enterococcus hulanensis]
MIAEILKAQRKKRGQTQQEVAEIFNVTRQTVSNWENEKNYPDVPTLVAISDYYEISLDYLMKGDAKYMAKMANEARLLQTIRIGLFSGICGGALLVFSIISFLTASNGGRLENIIPVQLLIVIAAIWLCVIHFKNLKEEMAAPIRTAASVFLLAALFVTLLCLMIFILAATGLIHF